MRSNLRLAVLALCALSAGACSRSGEENLGLEVAGASAPIDLTKITTPAELERALSLPGAALDWLLGAHRLTAQGSLTIEAPGRPAQKLEDTYQLDSDGKGALHFVHDDSREDGTEAVMTGGLLYVRPRYGRFVGRRPEGDDLQRLRATVEEVAADDFALLEPWLKLSEAGRVQVAGRDGIRLALSAAPEPGRIPKPRDPSQAWRKSVKVRYINGEVVVDARSGAPLSLELDTAYTFERAQAKGTPATITVTRKLTETLSAAQPIAAPDDAVIDPHRPRPMLDRQTLLSGLR